MTVKEQWLVQGIRGKQAICTTIRDVTQHTHPQQNVNKEATEFTMSSLPKEETGKKKCPA